MKGNVLAQSALGGIYHFGLGVQQDYAQARKWYELSAQQGTADATANAQFALGVMYYIGQGVPKDYIKAHMWFHLAGRKKQKH